MLQPWKSRSRISPACSPPRSRTAAPRSLAARTHRCRREPGGWRLLDACRDGTVRLARFLRLFASSDTGEAQRRGRSPRFAFFTRTPPHPPRRLPPGHGAARRLPGAALPALCRGSAPALGLFHPRFSPVPARTRRWTQFAQRDGRAFKFCANFSGRGKTK